MSWVWDVASKSDSDAAKSGYHAAQLVTIDCKLPLGHQRRGRSIRLTEISSLLQGNHPSLRSSQMLVAVALERTEAELSNAVLTSALGAAQWRVVGVQE